MESTGFFLILPRIIQIKSVDIHLLTSNFDHSLPMPVLLPPFLTVVSSVVSQTASPGVMQAVPRSSPAVLSPDAVLHERLLNNNKRKRSNFSTELKFTIFNHTQTCDFIPNLVYLLSNLSNILVLCVNLRFMI